VVNNIICCLLADYYMNVNNTIEKILVYIKNPRVVFPVILGVGVIISLLFYTLFSAANTNVNNQGISSTSSSENTSTQIVSESSAIITSASTATATPIPKVNHPLKGDLIEQSEYDRLTTLMMVPMVVENHPDARPQSGLSQAEVVYEYLAEGGITRYLAVFLGENPTRIGPERSLRTTFAANGAEYEGIVAHHGFTAKRPTGGYSIDPNLIDVPYFTSVNSIRHSECGGYRDPVLVARVAYEHTLFNTLDDFRNCTGFVPWNEKFEKYLFTSTPDIKNSTPANKIVLSLEQDTPLFEVQWNYNANTQTYDRVLAGKVDIDFNTSRQISVKNLIVMNIPMVYSNNSIENNVYYELIGEGTAFYIHDGVSQEIKWKKNSWKGRTKFYDPISGEEVKFQFGNFWYEMMSFNGTVPFGSYLVE